MRSAEEACANISASPVWARQNEPQLVITLKGKVCARHLKWKTRQLSLLVDGMLAHDKLGCITARAWLGWLRPHVGRIETHVPWPDSTNSGHLLLYHVACLEVLRGWLTGEIECRARA